MTREEKIKKIRGIIAEWGAFTTGEIEAECSPVFQHYGLAHYMLVEEFYLNHVVVTTYINEIALGSDDYSYDDLTDDTINDILDLAIDYDDKAWQENRKAKEYDHE